MNRKVIGPRLLLLGLGFIALTGFLTAQDEPNDDEGTKGIFDQLSLAKDEPPPEQEGVQAQAMGMVHEAFASPAVFTANVGNPIADEPPQAVEEMPPEHKPDGENVQWINGYFSYEEQKKDFYWVSGIWRNIPPSMEWVPGTWNRIAQGWVYYSGFWKRASEGELSVVPMPPEPLQTADPPAPNAESSYVPGCWVYRETRYVWRPACWAPYRAGWVWVSARYVLTHCGWTFVDGYWDYVIRDRGLLYCPVHISATHYRRPGFIYRPAYVVHDHALLSCLFINRRTGCYVFGDYYDDYYRRSGYVSWTSYRVNLHPEPLFSHYRHVHRRDPRWEINLVALQVERYRGVTARPAVTIIQQKTVINRNITQVNNLTLIAPATKINTKVVPLKRLDAAQVKTQFEASKKFTEATKLRAKNETNLAKSLGTVRVGDAPKTLALNLPRTTATTVVTTKIKNLPPPPTGQKTQIPVGVGTDKGVVSKDKSPTADKTVVVKDKKPADKVVLPKDKVVLPKDKVVLPKDKSPATDKVILPKDKVVLPKDKVVLPKDKLPPVKDKTPATDKVIVPKDKGPGADKVISPKDKLPPVKDKTPATDKVIVPKDKGPGADKVISPKDKLPPVKDKTPATDKVIVPKDKGPGADKVILPKDKLTPAKDKAATTTTDKAITDKATPAKDKEKAKDKAKAKGSVANPLNIQRTGASASPRLEAASAESLSPDRQAAALHFAARYRLL